MLQDCDLFEAFGAAFAFHSIIQFFLCFFWTFHHCTMNFFYAYKLKALLLCLPKLPDSMNSMKSTEFFWVSLKCSCRLFVKLFSNLSTFDKVGFLSVAWLGFYICWKNMIENELEWGPAKICSQNAQRWMCSFFCFLFF